jgi:hypothetical protein
MRMPVWVIWRSSPERDPFYIAMHQELERPATPTSRRIQVYTDTCHERSHR